MDHADEHSLPLLAELHAYSALVPMPRYYHCHSSPVTIYSPTEILSKILAYWHADSSRGRRKFYDFLSCARVNRVWHHLAMRLHWQQLSLNLHNKCRLQQTLERLDSHAPWTIRPEYVRHLDIVLSRSQRGFTSLPLKPLMSLLGHLRGVESLSVHLVCASNHAELYQQCIKRILSLLPRVKRLALKADFHDPWGWNGSHVMLHLLKDIVAYRKLESLAVDARQSSWGNPVSLPPSAIPSSQSSLRVLKLANMTVPDLAMVLPQFKHTLEYLDVQLPNAPDNADDTQEVVSIYDSLLPAIRACTRLHSIHIRQQQGRFIASSRFWKLMEALSTLPELRTFGITASDWYSAAHVTVEEPIKVLTFPKVESFNLGCRYCAPSHCGKHHLTQFIWPSLKRWDSKCGCTAYDTTLLLEHAPQLTEVVLSSMPTELLDALVANPRPLVKRVITSNTQVLGLEVPGMLDQPSPLQVAFPRAEIHLHLSSGCITKYGVHSGLPDHEEIHCPLDS